MPEILRKLFSEEEFRKLIDESRVNEVDLFFIIEGSYIKRIEVFTPIKRLNDEIKKLDLFLDF